MKLFRKNGKWEKRGDMRSYMLYVESLEVARDN